MDQALPLAGPWPFRSALEPGEQVHFIGPADRREFFGTDAVWTQSTLFIGGPALANGKPGRLGAGQQLATPTPRECATRRWRSVDHGTLYITSRRLLFAGRNGTCGTRLDAIVELNESDGGGLFVRSCDGETMDSRSRQIRSLSPC